MPKPKKFKAIELKPKNSPITENLEWEGESIQTESKTKLNEDLGVGAPVIIRTFTFGVNPQAFKEHKPTAQELFNSHLRGLESVLWRDGLRMMKEIEPQFRFSKDKKNYYITLTCEPSLGNVLADIPKTLAQIANGS